MTVSRQRSYIPYRVVIRAISSEESRVLRRGGRTTRPWEVPRERFRVRRKTNLLEYFGRTLAREKMREMRRLGIERWTSNWELPRSRRMRMPTNIMNAKIKFRKIVIVIFRERLLSWHILRGSRPESRRNIHRGLSRSKLHILSGQSRVQVGSRRNRSRRFRPDWETRRHISGRIRRSRSNMVRLLHISIRGCSGRRRPVPNT